MMPLIKQDRDLLIIEPVHGRLKKYDVPLYKRDNGQYVLHRILKVREQGYVICGDNRWAKEYGITGSVPGRKRWRRRQMKYGVENSGVS